MTRPLARALSRPEAWASALLGGVLVFSSTWRLTAGTWLSDELLYVRVGAEYVSGDVSRNLEHPPLAKLLFGVAGKIAGDGQLGARLVAAIASVTIGVLLFMLVRRISGNRAGVIALGLWAVLPHVGGGLSGPLLEAGRLDRFGMLDPVATALAMGALLAGLVLIEHPTWRWAAITGLCGGLAAGAKVTGVLVLPAIAIVLLWVHRREWRSAAPMVGVAAAASLIGFALVYAAFGSEALDAFVAMIDFQSRHAADGHLVTIAGTTTSLPPWWSHLFFHVRDDGWPLTMLLLLSVPAALVLRGRARGVQLLVVTFLVMFTVHAGFVVKLPQYRYLWMPVLVALLAVTADAGIDRIRVARQTHGAIRGPVPVALVAVGIASALVVTASAASTLLSIATLSPSGYPVMVEQLRAQGLLTAPTVVHARPAILFAYAPDLRQVEDLADATVVVLDVGVTSRSPRPELEALVTDQAWRCNESAGITVCTRST